MKVKGFSELKKKTKASLDEDTTKEMLKILHNLTSTGNPSLDDTELKKFKKFCRKSDDYVRYAFILIMEQLEKNHSEIRLSALQVAIEIFSRSHAFRDILVTHLQEFLTLTTGTETNQPLPPPKSAANRLKETTLNTVQQWYDDFGKSYRKLDVGYNYLKNCKLIDFQNIRAQNEAERLRAEQEEKRKKKQMADRLAQALQDIADNKPEIEDCIQEAENCLKLLLPTPDNFLLFSAEDAIRPLSTDVDQNQSNANTSPLRKSNPGADYKHCHVVNEIEKINNDCCQPLSVQSTMGNVSDKDVVEGKNDSGSKVQIENSHASESISNDLNCKSMSSASACVHTDVNGDNGVNESHNQHDDKAVSHDDGCDDNNEDEGEEDDYECDSDDIEDDRAHGFSKQGFNIDIEMPIANISVKETEDNTDVLQSLKDAAKLISTRFLLRVTKWLEILGKNGGSQADIKAMIDLKLNMESVKSKCTELKLVSMERLREDDSDDDDLEDVPEKEGYEASVPTSSGPHTGHSSQRADKEKTSLKKHLSADSAPSNSDSKNVSLKKAKSCGMEWNPKERETEESLADPTSRATALARINYTTGSEPTTSSSQPSTSNSKSIPFVDFGKDLAFWENPDKLEAPDIIKFDSLHRFWASGEKETEKTSQRDVGLMLNRTFKFTGQFEPVKWSCRAPLKDGKLCPRMDRVKCPFHGPIIPRDEDGKPSNKCKPSSSSTTAAAINTKTEAEMELPPWQDPTLQREIELATGHDLGSARSEKILEKALNKSKGKGKGKSRKKSGLTDIKAATNTARNRLEKRVFNRGSMKRVCATLDRADYKRARDKFGNQFNYSL